MNDEREVQTMRRRLGDSETRRLGESGCTEEQVFNQDRIAAAGRDAHPGDEARAFTATWHALLRVVRKWVRCSQTAEDIAATAIEKAWKLEEGRRLSERMARREKWGWLLRTARNLCIDHGQAQLARRADVADADEVCEDRREPSWVDCQRVQELVSLVRDRLEDGDRDTLCRLVLGESAAEIAALRGVTVRAAYLAVGRIRKAFSVAVDEDRSA